MGRLPSDPNSPPIVGTKINAIINEAERTATKVIGRNFMNSPTIPGQKISGKKAARVVAVDAIIGNAILLAAVLYASRRRNPRFCWRSANSVTTIAPSTNIPTDKIKLKRTTIFIESPNKERTRMPSKKEPGIAIPTNAPERQPSAPTMMIITSNTALIMLFCSSLNMVFIFVDRSCENVYLSPSGQFLLVVSTTDRTRLTVSIMFSPLLFFISIPSDFSPANRAIEEGSLNDFRTLAISPIVTIESPETFKGCSRILGRSSYRPGTFIGNRPFPASNVPAAINRLERVMV